MDYQNDPLTSKIIECIIAVHPTLGPGFLESIYRNALLLELRHKGLYVETEKELQVLYLGTMVGTHRLDLLVENEVVLELKTVEELGKAHYAQIRSYMKAAKLRKGLLVNFAGDMADFRRIED